MAEAISLILKNTLSITFFVLVMMLIIEYINVKTAGAFSKKIKRNGFRQILISSILGIIPGCLGTYTVVTLYTHRMVSFGALTATFIATMGDEAFLFFSTMPQKAIMLTGIMFVIAIISGLIIDAIVKKKNAEKDIVHFHVHEEELPVYNSRLKTIKQNIQKASPHRALLLFGVLSVIAFALFTDMGHNHEFLSSVDVHECTDHTHHHHAEGVNWMSFTFISISLIAFYILSLVPEHFLEEHFWKHIIKKHFFKILGWTALIITGVYFINLYVDVKDYIDGYKYHILLIAVLVGLIPESGPHVIFLSLYLSGTIPLAILLANSIVQDGHGALPLFAENKKAFISVKLINMIIGLLVGITALQV